MPEVEAYELQVQDSGWGYLSSLLFSWAERSVKYDTFHKANKVAMCSHLCPLYGMGEACWFMWEML